MPIDKSQSLSVAGTAGLRAVGLIDARTLRSAAGTKDTATPAASTPTLTSTPAATFQPSAALDPGQAPVDIERVAVIRKAIESGAYPVIPTKIADAMIAAGLLLRASA